MKTPESQTAPGSGTLAFVTTALIFLVLGSISLAAQPGFLLADTLTSAGQAWVTLMIYGFGLPAVFAVVYWALPAAFSLPLFSKPAVFLHWGFHLAGLLVVLLVSFFPEMPQAPMGATFLACGGIIFVVNVGMTLRGMILPDASSAFLIAVIIWLVIALFLGLPFAPGAPLPMFVETNWKVAWLVFVVAGVLINTILGLALRVTPVALGTETPSSATSWWALAVTNLAIAWMFPALTYGPLAGVFFCATVFLVGILIYLGEFHGILQRPASRAAGWDTRILLAALWMIPAATTLLLWDVRERIGLQSVAQSEAVATASPAVETTASAVLSVLPMDWTAGLTALLATAVPGLIALVFLLLKLQKGLPGENAALSVSGRLAGQLLLAAFFNYAIGAGMLILGAWGASEKILSLGAIFLVVGSAGFIANFINGLKSSPTEQPATEACPT